MRLWSISGLSVMVVVASAAALVATPALRMVMVTVFDPTAYDIDFTEYAVSHPEDYPAWLAALATGHESDEEVYRHAAALAPEDPAPRMIYATKLLQKVPLERKELEALWPDVTVTEKPLTSFERAAWEEALNALDHAAQLDPENAAPDFLRAYLALAVHDDERADQLLSSALSKERFTLYTHTALVTSYETAHRSMPSLYAATAACLVGGSGPLSRFRQMARVLKGASLAAERDGDEGRAIFLRESLLHWGELMWRDADTLIEALVGLALWGIAAEKDLTDAERAAATKWIPRPDETRPGSETQYWEAQSAAAQAKLAAYLGEHGRKDLADSVITTGKLGREWMAAARYVVTSDEWTEWDTWEGYMHGAKLASQGAGLALVFIALWGLTALAMRSARRPVRPMQWPRWGWGLVAAVCLVGGAAVSAGLSSLIEKRGAEGTVMGSPMLLVGVQLGAVSLGVAAVVWLRRRRHREIREISFPQQYVGTSLAVLLPLAALACLLVVGVAGCAARNATKLTRKWVGEIYQGELVYHHLALEEWEGKAR